MEAYYMDADVAHHLAHLQLLSIWDPRGASWNRNLTYEREFYMGSKRRLVFDTLSSI
jgi:hypothetical protein